MAAQHLTITRLDKHFGSFQALTDVNLNIEKGEFCALLGPSGCGKSTLLRLIAGLEEVTAGQIHIAGKEVTHLEPSQRKIAMVFQSYALYPHMTVAENIAFSLEVMGIPKNQRLQKAREIADLLQLTLLLERRPAVLSGGQRQRVAIGRALVREPEVFLFDEPLSNLDALLRVKMRIELINLHRKIGATMVYVTHDQIEAMTMADKIVVMNQGVIQQIGAPMALYNQPANRFVAGFVGSPSMNFLAARVERQYENQTALRIGEQVLDLGYTIAAPEGQSLTLGIRAEDCQSGGTLFNGMVKLVERLGSQTLCHLETALGDICIQDVGNSMVRLGDTLPFDLNMARAHLFSHSGERLLTN